MEYPKFESPLSIKEDIVKIIHELNKCTTPFKIHKILELTLQLNYLLEKFHGRSGDDRWYE